MDEAARQGSPLTQVELAVQAAWQSRLSDVGEYNILVEGLSDKVYLELAAQKLREATGVDLLENGRVRIIAGRGTKRAAPDFGLLQSLESQGIRFVFILDNDELGQMAAEAMGRFNAQKGRHFFHLERPDYKDKSGKSWPVEIEDMLPWPLLEAYIAEYPEAIEERFQRGNVHKVSAYHTLRAEIRNSQLRAYVDGELCVTHLSSGLYSRIRRCSCFSQFSDSEGPFLI